MSHYEVVVVGAGMMGAAAAKYLAREVESVALIGPGEPMDMKNHQGVFASHYDAGRITRTIDRSRDWALLANRSIARYAEIESESGISFYTPAGCLYVGPEPSDNHPLVAEVVAASTALDIAPEQLSSEALTQRFPLFSFEPASAGVFEASDAGHINPRHLVAAQCKLAVKAGADHIEAIVTSVKANGDHVEVLFDNGTVLSAQKVLVACGGFTNGNHLLPEAVEIEVYGRTITLFEVPEDDADLYRRMPSLIYDPRDKTKHIYLLAPLRYPDGKLYMKIGGDPRDRVIKTDAEMRDWFRSGGDDAVRQHHASIVAALMPTIPQDRVTKSACVVTYTPSGYPAIGYTSSDRIAVLTGGCGAAAKSSDEIGRLGAELILTGRIQPGVYHTDFAPKFA